MTTRTLFPIKLYVSDMGTWVNTPDLAKKIWNRLRAKNPLTWYAADCEILSEHSVRIHVYDMKDSFHGGIGDEIFQEVITEFSPEEEVLIQQCMMREMHIIAVEEFEAREQAARKEKIAAIRKELFGK